MSSRKYDIVKKFYDKENEDLSLKNDDYYYYYDLFSQDHYEEYFLEPHEDDNSDISQKEYENSFNNLYPFPVSAIESDSYEIYRQTSFYLYLIDYHKKMDEYTKLINDNTMSFYITPFKHISYPIEYILSSISIDYQNQLNLEHNIRLLKDDSIKDKIIIFNHSNKNFLLETISFFKKIYQTKLNYLSKNLAKVDNYFYLKKNILASEIMDLYLYDYMDVYLQVESSPKLILKEIEKNTALRREQELYNLTLNTDKEKDNLYIKRKI